LLEKSGRTVKKKPENSIFKLKTIIFG